MKRKKAKAKRKKIKMQQKKAHVFNNLILSDQERDLFLKEVENPKPPNRALRQAARRFLAQYGDGEVERTKYITFDELYCISEKATQEFKDQKKKMAKIAKGLRRLAYSIK